MPRVSQRCLIFFFQAEDGIRDSSVTGVQTCALPISARAHERGVDSGARLWQRPPHVRRLLARRARGGTRVPVRARLGAVGGGAGHGLRRARPARRRPAHGRDRARPGRRRHPELLPLPGRPLLVFPPEPRPRELLALYRARGLNLAHAVALPFAALGTRDLVGLKRLVFDENDGFWLSADDAPAAAKRLPLDSLGRWLRRLAKPALHQPFASP